MKISACWITKNEAANIGLSIESVRGAADELLVVDTGSSDGTAAIAESLGARVARFDWVGDFSAARNYTLSLASGGIVIFLDADEWFEPRLRKADGVKIKETFSKNPRLEVILTQICNIEKQSGAVGSTNVSSRIFLNKETLRYQGKIHEFLNPSPKDAYIFMPSLSLRHSGYSRDVAADKMERNLALLEAGLEGGQAVEGDDRTRFLLYLVREHHNRREFEKAGKYMPEILRNPGALERLCEFHSQALIPILYPVMWTAFRLRGSVSRLAVRHNIFNVFKKAYPGYQGSVEIDLLYQALFDMKEDRFLKEFEPAARAAAAMKPSAIISYRESERFLFEKAALAAWRRRDGRAAAYSAAALRDSGKYRQWLLYTLLNSSKGQPPGNVIAVLNGIYKTSEPGDLDFLIRGTCIDGCAAIHAYYLEKRVNSPDAYIRDYLHFTLIRKSFDALARAAAEAHSAGDLDAALYLFLACVCGAPAGLTEPHAAILKDYAHVLSAWRKRERLAAVSEPDARLLRDTYPTVAFVAGMEAADRYLDVFRADAALCFTIKAAYCEISDLPEHLLSEDTSLLGGARHVYRNRMIRAMLAAGRYDEAVREIEMSLRGDFMEPELLQTLLAAAGKAEGETKGRARKLYERHAAAHDLLIDLRDAVNTGIVFDSGGKKQNQFFKNMTRAQFDKYLADESAQPAPKALLDLYRKAADIYRKNGVPTEAARCLWRLTAHGQAEKETREELAKIFAELNNAKLAEYIRQGRAPGPVSPAGV